MHTMITKLKISLIGATGVGKSSLADRFVHSMFSDSYRTTIGVKIEALEVRRGDRAVQLVIWDMSGEDEFQSVQTAYVTGTAGYFVVVDGTRRATADTGVALMHRVREAVGNVPFIVVVNKNDLVAAWELRPCDLERLAEDASGIVYTSARTGAGVKEAFHRLADAILTPMGPGVESLWT
jgi:small GTP-binding protein